MMKISQKQAENRQNDYGDGPIRHHTDRKGKKMVKSKWKNSYHYQRILQLLDAYWLSEPDELYVEVEMTFLKANGEWQKKVITWFNPNYEVAGEHHMPEPVDLEELAENVPDEEDFIPYLRKLRHGEITKKGANK